MWLVPSLGLMRCKYRGIRIRLFTMSETRQRCDEKKCVHQHIQLLAIFGKQTGVQTALHKIREGQAQRTMK